MRAVAYYNENDEEKAAWLRELIQQNVIAPGEVDEHSIKEVQPEDLEDFVQCHFFAGIGVWSYSLRLAGWPDDRPVWTGSCPCPSFSAAGKGKGFDDPRHLWPDWARLIRKCRPATLFGEQVDDAIGFGWLDFVQTDLEREDYAVGKAVLGACSVGAPHIRQRLYFVAHSEYTERRAEPQEYCEAHGRSGFGRSRATGRLDKPHSGRRSPRQSSTSIDGHGRTTIAASASGDLVHSKRNGREQSAEVLCEGQPVISRTSEGVCLGNASSAGLSQRERDGRIQRFALGAQAGQASECGSYVAGFWRDADWVLRKRWNSDDSEWCPTEPGTFPLAHGVANRVLKLRGYGDAIVAEVAKAFIESYCGARPARGR
jgi:DNA (cytosine-5)-methyltransferase 1